MFRAEFSRRIQLVVSLPFTLGAAVVAIPVALAEEVQVEDVKVTGGGRDEKTGLTRREEKILIDTPRSAGVVNGEKAQQQHIERLSDFAQRVPNYNPAIGNPRTSRPAIRGVGVGAGNGDGAESDTGFIVDNVFYKHVGFQWADFIDLESFEIELGPRGTTGGKNTTVGAINIRTQLPSFERKATFETSFANYNHIIEKLNVTGPVIDDKLAYRVALYLDKGDGWIRDQVTGASVLNNNRWGARGQLLYVGDNFTDRLIFNYATSHEYNNSNTGVFSDSLPLYANGALGRTYSQTVWRRLNKPILTFDPFKPYYTHLGTLDARQYTASNEANIQIGENTLTSISAWGRFVLHPRNSMGNQELETSDGHTEVWAQQFSQELRLASPKDQKLEWLGGIFAFYEKIHSYAETIYGSDAAQWHTASPSTDPGLMAGFRRHADGKSTTFNIAGYGQATYHVDDQLALTLGLRNGYEVKGGSNFAWVGAWSDTYSFGRVYDLIASANGTGFFDTGGQKVARNMFTGIFNPSYKIDENILLYGLVGRGEKAPAVNTAAQAIWSGEIFKGWQPLFTKAETSWDYELGVKTNWLDNTLIANVNLYWTDIYNFQASMVNSSLTDATGEPIRQNYLGNIPHVRLRGVEFVGRWSPIERLWLSFNGAYTEARYVDFQNAPVPDDWNWPKPSSAPAEFLKAPLSLSLSNSRFTNLPKWAFNIGAEYSHPLGPAFRDLGSWADHSLTAFGYANLAWSDKYQLTNPWSVFQYWQPAYSIVNAGVGLRTDDERYSLQLWVKNLFDKRYIPPTPTGGGWTPGTPTTPASYNLQAQPRYFGGTLLVKLY